MTEIRIIQVGDIHFPDAKLAKVPLDDKDPNFPFVLKGILSRQKLKTVFKSIHEEMHKNPCDAIMFMGDFTDLGDLQGFKSCLKFITSSLELGKKQRNGRVLSGFVPGNHDIDRNLAMKPSLDAKFSPLEEAARKAGVSNFPTTKMISRLLKPARGKGQVEIMMLNSCWGCGEPEHLPEPFKTEISVVIKKLLTKSKDKKNNLKKYYDRQFDSPAFNNSHIQEATTQVIDCADNAVPVICAHHNILPQAITRLAPYTELVNSGAFRTAILGSNKTTIYLHGHIHEDPIEIISNGTGGKIISISAPDALKGYNIIRLKFDNTGTPYSCYVDSYRFDEGGMLIKAKSRDFGITTGNIRYNTSQQAKVLAKIIEEKAVHWQDISEYSIQNEYVKSETELVELLEVLRADKRVKIHNHERDHIQWLIVGA